MSTVILWPMPATPNWSECAGLPAAFVSDRLGGPDRGGRTDGGGHDHWHPRSEWAEAERLDRRLRDHCPLRAAVACSSTSTDGSWSLAMRLEPFAFTVIDVVALTVFQLLSTDGIYPLLIMTLLPILLGLDVRFAARGGGVDLSHAGVRDRGVPRPGDDQRHRMVRSHLPFCALWIPLCHGLCRRSHCGPAYARRGRAERFAGGIACPDDDGVGRAPAQHFGIHSRRTAAGHPGGAPGDRRVESGIPR